MKLLRRKDNSPQRNKKAEPQQEDEKLSEGKEDNRYCPECGHDLIFKNGEKVCAHRTCLYSEKR